MQNKIYRVLQNDEVVAIFNRKDYANFVGWLVASAKRILRISEIIRRNIRIKKLVPAGKTKEFSYFFWQINLSKKWHLISFTESGNHVLNEIKEKEPY